MKKYIYLCILFLFSLNTMAQIGVNNGNWDTVFYDDFSRARVWDTMSWFSLPDYYWKAHPGDHITHGDREAQIYQYDHCVFDLNENAVYLVSEFDNQGLIPLHQYHLPSVMQGYFPNPLGYHKGLYFFSGEMDVIRTQFSFGYFEIRCKLPLHNGSFPAFWLYGPGPEQYEEIDIFEYSPGDCLGDVLRGYSSGIWHNPQGTNYEENEDNDGAQKFNETHYHLSLDEPDLSQYHIYGCEWMPDYVKWYRDGEVVSQYHDVSHIPQYPKTLKINYAILKNYLQLDTINNVLYGWSGSDTLTIDYVKVLQLKTDCETDEIITTGIQFANYDCRFKHSITIGSIEGQVIVPSNTSVSMLAEEYIIINGEFEISPGSEMILSVHACPR